MEYDEWMEGKSTRVWLSDSMTALAQFAYVSPIPRVMHYNRATGGRYPCVKEKYGKCDGCDRGVDQISEFTYGIYIADKDKNIKHFPTSFTTNQHLQEHFRKIFAENINPCSILFEVSRGKIKTLTGRMVNGYSFKPLLESEPFVGEADRPSPFDDDKKWVVDRLIAESLRDLDGEQFNLIDLFLEMKSRFPHIEDKKLKSYAIRLCAEGVLDLRRAKE
tara:strand:+ start:3581 stop:4237 length:657 start_codon:yes stop_codon:yes gene_type:complete